MQPDNQQSDQGYVLKTHSPVVQPIPGETPAENNPAIDLIRQKLTQLYSNEPSALEEEREVEQLPSRSKHQEFMYQLSISGQSLADIQTAWHNYYVSLPEHEKHEVWQEFYANHSRQMVATAPVVPQLDPARIESPIEAQPADEATTPPQPQVVDVAPQTFEETRNKLLNTVKSRSRASKKQHAQSLAFGLMMGFVMVGILSFGFFNERFIAPFMTPSRAVSSTPIIIDPSSSAIGTAPEVIIPKINVQIPVVYDVPTIDEPAVEKGLERGVVHYASTPLPGQNGNGVIFGHSANNILNKGKYKFAFVLLKKLDIGDTFYIQKDGKRYVYRVYEKKIVPPTDVSVLNTQEKPATFTLITCDPPGTSLNRLIVVGEQISPDPASNAASTAQTNIGEPSFLPSNSPTLWSRLTHFLSN